MRFQTLCSLLLLAVIIPLSQTRGAQEPTWQAGIAAVKITPDKPLVLAGYAARTKPFETIDQDIEAKALALRDSQGTRALLITLDLIGLPGDVADEVRQRIAQKSGLKLAQIVLSSAHTHSAPLISSGRGGDGELAGQDRDNTVEYTRHLEDKLVDLADRALSQMKPARLSWGVGVANFVMNRREFTDHGVILGVNPRGPVDRSVPVLRIDRDDGSLTGVLFAYACHNTTMPSNRLAVSADYEGYAKAYIQQQNPGAAAMFMIGCGGDANPYPREQVEAAVTHGEELGKEVSRVLKTRLAPVRGPLNCIEQEVDLPLQTPGRSELEKLAQSSDSLKRESAKQMLRTLDSGRTLPRSHHSPVIVWQFGDDLTMVQLPQEVVVDYVHDIENAVGPMRLWIAAYCNEVAGYVPSARVLREGGYETRGLYIGTGWFAPQVEQTLTNAVAHAARLAGRHK